MFLLFTVLGEIVRLKKLWEGKENHSIAKAIPSNVFYINGLRTLFKIHIFILYTTIIGLA